MAPRLDHPPRADRERIRRDSAGWIFACPAGAHAAGVDAPGAGDIFAAAFFIRLLKTRDPWEATRFATLLATCSVTRIGLDGIATPREIEECMMEVLH